MATYLSAQQAGFTGSYQDWINQGRPSNDGESLSSGEKAAGEMAALQKEYNVGNLPVSERANNLIGMTLRYVDSLKGQLGLPKQGGGVVTMQEITSQALANTNWDYLKQSGGGLTVPQEEYDLLQNLLPTVIKTQLGDTTAKAELNTMVNKYVQTPDQAAGGSMLA
jgi:hypothetical protein